MGIGLNTALSLINPNEGRVERLAREENRMRNLNATIDQDREIQRRDEEQIQASQAELEKAMQTIAPQDQERVRTQMQEARNKLYEEFKNAGGVQRFMRRGGMRMVQEYQDSFVNSTAMAKGRQNAYQLTRMNEFNKNKIPLSKRSLMEYNAWMNGERDSFEVIPLQQIDLTELQKTKFTSQNIEPWEIMQRYKAELTANWVAETGSKALPTDNVLLQYTKDNYGNIMGAIPDRYQSSERYPGTGGGSSGSRGSYSKSRTASGVTRNQQTMILTSLSDINAISDNNLKVTWGNNKSAHTALSRTGLFEAGILDPRAISTPNKMEMSFQEGYQVKGYSGDELMKAIGNEKVDGKFVINTGTHSVYNAKGISAANNDDDGLGVDQMNVAVTAGRVFMVKKRNTMYMPGRDQAYQNANSMLIMNSNDKGEQENIEGMYQEDLAANKGKDEISLVQIVELTDSDGNNYYMEVGNIANEASRINHYFEKELNLGDVVQESYDINQGTMRTKQTIEAINTIPKEQYKNTVPVVNKWLNDNMLPVDENFVAPLFNSIADALASTMSNPNQYSRNDIIEKSVIPYVHQLMRDHENFRKIFYNDQGQTMRDLLRFVEEEMPEISDNFKTYTGL